VFRINSVTFVKFR